MGEPFRVQKAQFFGGALPGTPPVSMPPQYVPGDLPIITDMLVNGVQFLQGSGGKKLSGRTSENGYSVGLQAEGLGSGWWMIAAGDMDTSYTPPRAAFTAVTDFAHDLKPGPFPVLFVALDREGRSGAQFREPLCVISAGPDADSACNGTPLPAAAISLTWDTNVDIDLAVLTPDGKLVTPKHPQVHDVPKGDTGELSPHIDRDSNANCVLDGYRSESLIWPTLTEAQGETEHPEGLYQVFVNLFDPCGQQAVRYRLKITTAEPAGDDGAAGAGGDERTVEHVWVEKSGELIAIQSSPADEKGTYVTEFTFP